MFKKYAAAILPALIVLLGALQTSLADGTVTESEAGQLIVLVGGTIAVYFVPLSEGAWRGALKTGAAVVTAVGSLIIPLLVGFTWESAVIFALAALSAIATEMGVGFRTTDEDSE